MSFEKNMMSDYKRAKLIVSLSDEYDNTDHTKTAWMNDHVCAEHDAAYWRKEISKSKDFLARYEDYCKRLIANEKCDE